ncbi:MAG TPA: hypothetical protein VN752_02725 [Solirubrobacterales bacterium]|nr:hypothetical protein [Solirubrobacterales bacterium]
MAATERVVCVVTGPVLGLESQKLLESTKAFGAELGRQVEVFDLFQEMAAQDAVEISKWIERLLYIRRLLEGYDYQFELKRRNAYCSIGRKIGALPEGVHAIVRAPSAMEFRGVTTEFKDHRAIATLRPTRIVTLIDAEWKIHKRLLDTYGKRAFELIAQAPNLDLERILGWLGAEVSASEDWAEWCSHLNGTQVGHVVLGVTAPARHNRAKFVQDVDNLLKAASVEDLPTFYASYSMTVAEERERKVINDAIWRLREHALVIDPGTIELDNSEKHDEDRVVFAYTVFRDLRWDVKKVDAVAAFHPYEKTVPPLSTGMMDELGHARAYGKDSYFVLPRGSGSPFTGGNLVPANHLFKTVDQFFDFIEKRRRPPIKARFAKQVSAFEQFAKQSSS